MIKKNKSFNRKKENKKNNGVLKYKSFFSRLLVPISLLYIFFFAIINYRFRKQKVLCKKTICVDSIVEGPTNKTQICIDICNSLMNENRETCFITVDKFRKMKRTFVVPKDHYFIFNSNEVGEKTLLFSKSGDVFLVKDRYYTNAKKYDVAICDGGFFDETIKKDCNIIVFNYDFFVGNGYVKPAGKLKYRLKSLNKADFIIILDAKESDIQEHKKFLLKFVNEDRVLTANIVDNDYYDKKLNYMAFAKNINSENFFSILKTNGFNIKKFLLLKRNKKYNKKMFNFIKIQFKLSCADKIIISKKDFIELPKYFLDELPFVVFDFNYKIDNINKIFAFLFDDKIKK